MSEVPPMYQDNKPMVIGSCAAGSLHGSYPDRSVVPPMSTSVPLPALVGPSKASPRCRACGREGCPLPTHKEYSRYAATPRRLPFEPTRQLSTPSQSTPSVYSTGALFQLPSQIENPRIDPFADYPIPMNQETHRLLDLWSRPWAHIYRGPQRHLFPSPVINTIIPYAMKSGVFFQALIPLTATQRAQTMGKIDEVALRHQTAAIRLHAEAVRDEKEASTDGNILSALVIMSNHLAMGNIPEAERHMMGVNHLVKLRGGPQYLGWGGVVASYVMYADHSQAVLNDKPPLWKMPLPSLKFRTSSAPRLGAGFKAMHGSQELDVELLAVGEDICRLADLIDFGARGKVPQRELHSVGYLSMVAEYQLAHLNSIYHHTSTRSECVCLGLVLFDHVVLRNVGAINPGIRKIEYAFWTAFQAAMRRGAWEIDNTGLLIWTIFAGLTTMVRAECPWKSYATQCLRKARARLVLRDWADVTASVLDPFAWSEMAQEEVYRRIWNEAENPQIFESQQ